MRIVSLAAGIVLLATGSARACDPIDATLSVTDTRDGFLFVTRETVVRFSPSGEVQHRRVLDVQAHSVHLLSDRRTLLATVAGGEFMDCHGSELAFVLYDTASSDPPRRLGVLPGHGVRSTARMADGTLIVRLTRYDYDADRMIYDDVRVRPDTRRVRAARVRVRGEGEPPELAHVDEERALTIQRDEREVRVVDESGNVRVTVAVAQEWPRAALSADGRQLAIATYSVVNEDYGTGFDGRLEIVELATGAHRTVHATGNTIAAVRGTVSCEERVHDPSSALNVRVEPSPRAAIAGTIAHDTAIAGDERRGPWRRITAPVAGWIWAENVRRTCR